MCAKITKEKKISNNKMKELLSYFWYRFFGLPFRFLRIRNNRLFISSHYGKGFGDSAKYIVDVLLKGEKNIEIIWLVKDLQDDSFPNGVKTVKRGSLKELYYLSTSRVWLDNARKPLGVKKRRGQFYIQTWHSSLRLKKIEKDAEKYLSNYYLKAARHDSEMIDLITSGCRFSTNIYKESFWYNGEVLECGTPRCDVLFDDKKTKKFREKICKQYNMDASKKLVLYAPTFRNDKVLDNRYLDCNAFSQALGDSYNMMIRLHPNMSGVDIKNNLIDVTKYSDMQELICAVDYLITDYSGCCFDMMIAGKPCVLYTPDLKQYLRNERDLYFSFDELPFRKTTNIDELANTIKNFDMKDYLNKVKEFSKKIGLKEKGDASKIIAKIIIDVCKREK